MTEQGYWWKVNIKAIQNYGRRERGVKKDSGMTTGRGNVG